MGRRTIPLLLPPTIAAAAALGYFALVEASAGAGCARDAHLHSLGWFVVVAGLSIAVDVAILVRAKTTTGQFVVGVTVTLVLVCAFMAYASLYIGANHGCWS